MKSRARKTVLLIVVTLIVVASLWLFIEHNRAKWAVTSYKKKLLASGEKLMVAELLPTPIPKDLDGTVLFRKAIQKFQGRSTALDTNWPNATRMVAPGKAVAGWQLPEVVDIDFSSPAKSVTNSWAEIESALADKREALDACYALAERPHADLRLDYEEGFSLLLPHLAPTKGAAWKLTAAALSGLRRGDTAGAVTNLHALIAVVKATEDERLVISQLVRIAIANITFTANWALLQSPAVTDEQLATLQRDWSELEFNLPTENALAMERAMSEMVLARMRESSREFNNVVTGFSGSRGSRSGGSSSGNFWDNFGPEVDALANATRMKARETAWRLSWSYVDELRALKGHQVLLDSFRRARTNDCYHPAILEEKARLTAMGIVPMKSDDSSLLFDPDNDLRELFTHSIVSLTKVLNRVMSAEAARQLAISGIALKRYHLRHGSYPTNLAALVPEFVETIPRDPVDGQPLRYRATANDSFVLYSIGEDAKDDGGDPVNPKAGGPMVWSRGRDWVWPQPASEEEIRAFYEKQFAPAKP
ncbi:MAG: hypothetical protein EPO07_04795 [Verrucomicrobia bacterium]|nr:MAG: hypothetical protein EPO07_04795 [Verrucomicrobiota bacterium]